MLEEAFLRMQETGCEAIPVVHNSRLVGLLTLENVGELMMISSALRQAQLSRGLGLQPSR
jgi:CBS domain-containing protein